MKESEIQKDILEVLKSQGMFFRINSGIARSFSNNFMRLAPKGTADIIGIKNGKAIAIEVKSATGKQSKVQILWQQQWESNGGIYIIARCIDDVLKIIQNL